MKKKILIATDSFLPRWDGISRFLLEVINRIKDNYQITILCPDFPGEKITFPNIKIIYFKTFLKISDTYTTLPKTEIIKKEVLKSDLIFSQTIGPIGSKTVKIAKKFHKPIIAYIHSIEWELFSKSTNNFLKKIIYRLTKHRAKKHYNRTNLILTPSLEIAELFNWLKIKPKKEIVHLGVDSNIFTATKNKKSAKINVKLPADHIIIGYVGRIAREKDILTLYRAFVRIRKIHKKTSLVIIGDGLDSIKKQLENKRNVILIKSQHNIVKYYHAMDIFVQPSLTETTSLTVMEAMSCGLPVISTRVGFIKDYITKGVNGIFFEKQNAYSLYTKILSLINNPKLREKISENARLTILKNYQWKETSKKIKEIFNKF